MEPGLSQDCNASTANRNTELSPTQLLFLPSFVICVTKDEANTFFSNARQKTPSWLTWSNWLVISYSESTESKSPSLQRTTYSYKGGGNSQHGYSFRTDVGSCLKTNTTKENKRLLPPPLPNHQENPTKPQAPLTIRRSNKSSPMPFRNPPDLQEERSPPSATTQLYNCTASSMRSEAPLSSYYHGIRYKTPNRSQENGSKDRDLNADRRASNPAAHWTPPSDLCFGRSAIAPVATWRPQ